MSKPIVLLTSLLFASSLLLLAPDSEADARANSYTAPTASAGSVAFLKLNCDKCHSIKKLKIPQAEPEEGKKKKRNTDLSRAGKGHDKAWLTGWMKKTITKTKTKKDGTIKEYKHKKKFKGSGGQLSAIVNMLVKLK